MAIPSQSRIDNAYLFLLLVGFREPERILMIRKLANGQYRLYSRSKNPKTGKRRNLGTFNTLEAAEKHEREVQYFKRLG